MTERKWLDQLGTPRDLRKLSVEELEQVSHEIRQVIIETVSETGGHLSSNLGNVELVVALHTIFESPHDRILWDTGHQTYAHKILTGRLGQFSTLRQIGGLSGFPTPEESAHDFFITGHEGTGLSQALGVARARDLLGEKYPVVCVIGDATLTSGMALEAINNIPHFKSNFIVILNDNEMSISQNVGAIAKYLTQIRTNPMYRNIKDRVERIFKKIPRIGQPLVERAEELRHVVKRFLVSWKAGAIFDDLGYKYIGPVDGANIPILLSVLRYAKEATTPVLIHVVSEKGKGYLPAQKNPILFHSSPPFDRETGAIKKSAGPPSYSSVFGKTMVRLGKKNNRLVGITAAMCDGTGLDQFAREFPDRFYDVGIAEEHAVTFAGALAKSGFDPVFAVYSTFLQRGYDQIIHDVCLQNAHVVFAMDRAGVVGQDAPTHTGAYDMAFLRSMPNIVIAAPKDENELQHLLFTGLNHDGPFAIRYPRGRGVGVPLDDLFSTIPLGQGEIVYATPREKILAGKNVGIIAIGSMVYPSINAAHILEEEGYLVTVLNARFVKPLDREKISEMARRVDALVIVEEGTIRGGFGSATLELLVEESLNNVAIRMIGLPDKFLEHGPEKDIRARYGLTAEGISQEVLTLFASRKPAKFELSRLLG